MTQLWLLARRQMTQPGECSIVNHERLGHEVTHAFAGRPRNAVVSRITSTNKTDILANCVQTVCARRRFHVGLGWDEHITARVLSDRDRHLDGLMPA